MEIYCTYFDSNFLVRALALYNSLVRHTQSFQLWALCLDEKAYGIVSELSLSGLIPISLDEFEQGDPDLLKAKTNRSIVEYFFTLTPTLPLFVLGKNPEYQRVTYLDADLFFFSDPSPIFEEFGDGSVLLIGHRFAERLKHLENRGIYNVGFLTFQRSEAGLGCLNWWRKQCLNWCYDRVEEGRFADQKYLDAWPSKFEGVRELKHLGAGLAPWNFGNYDYENRDGAVYVNSFELLFYHFHGLRRQSPLLLDPSLAGYDSNSLKIQFLKNALYKPYIRELLSIKQRLANRKFSAGMQSGSIKYQTRGLTIERNLRNRINHILLRLKVGIIHIARGYWWFTINDRIF